MKDLTREELEAEVRRLWTLAEDLALQLQRSRRKLVKEKEEADMLRAQNDLLQELLEKDGSPDTLPAPRPSPISPVKTKPSSPKAIRVEEVLAALEESQREDGIDDEM